MNTYGAVDRLLASMTDATDPRDVFADDAVLDATVPNWRFSIKGADTIRRQLVQWFADPAQFEELRRVPMGTGELIEFTLSWSEHGVPHACHQAHILEVSGDRIVADTMFCGGRWPAALLAEMEEAAHAG